MMLASATRPAGVGIERIETGELLLEGREGRGASRSAPVQPRDFFGREWAVT